MSLAYLNKVPSQIRSLFEGQVTLLAKELGVQPDWLMGAMYFESRLRPSAVNPTSGATGLIQFMPETAADLGTSTAALSRMSFLQQLGYVRKYLLPFKGKIKSPTDLYLTVFFPAAVGKPGNFIIQTPDKSAALIARQNPALDLNKNGLITKAEVEQSYTNWHKSQGVVLTAGISIIAMLGIGAAVWYWRNKRKKHA